MVHHYRQDLPQSLVVSYLFLLTFCPDLDFTLFSKMCLIYPRFISSVVFFKSHKVDDKRAVCPHLGRLIGLVQYGRLEIRPAVLQDKLLWELVQPAPLQPLLILSMVHLQLNSVCSVGREEGFMYLEQMGSCCCPRQLACSWQLPSTGWQLLFSSSSP